MEFPQILFVTQIDNSKMFKGRKCISMDILMEFSITQNGKMQIFVLISSGNKLKTCTFAN